MKKRYVGTFILLALLVVVHYLAAAILADRIQDSVNREISKPGSVSVSLGEVSIQPFRGNIGLSDLNLEYPDRSYRFNLGNTYLDLTYLQLWRLYLEELPVFLQSLDELKLTGYQLQAKSTLWNITSSSISLKIRPHSSDHSRNDPSSGLMHIAEKAELQAYAEQIHYLPTDTTQKKEPIFFARSIEIGSLELHGQWDRSAQQFKIDQLITQSSQLTINGRAAVSLNNRLNAPTLTDLQFSASYPNTFRLALGDRLGTFRAKNLQWTREKDENELETNYLMGTLLGGRHTLTLDRFNWILPPDFSRQLSSYTGGIAQDTLSGDSLNVKYRYNPKMHQLDLRELSYKTPDYAIFANGEFTVNPDHISETFIRNAEIKIFDLSDQLKSTLKQIENFFDIQIVDPREESIRIYLHGKLHAPEWKLL